MLHIPARFEGMQEWPGRESFALWTIFIDIPKHPAGSTLSINTLNKEGYQPYEIKKEKQQCLFNF